MENINKAQKDRNCQHPESSRIDLTNGKGFICGTCDGKVYDQPETQIADKMSAIIPTEKLYGVKQNGHSGKKMRFLVTYTTPKGVTSPVGSKQYKTEAEAQAAAEQLNKGVNAPTVKAVSAPKGSEEKAQDAAKRKAKADEKAAEAKKKAEEKVLAARKRKDELKEIESQAKRLIKVFGRMEEAEGEFECAFNRYCEVFDEFRPLFENLGESFRRLKDEEDIMGHHSLETWCPAFIKRSARTFRRLMRPKFLALIPANVPEKQDGDIEDAEFQDVPNDGGQSQPAQSCETEIGVPETEDAKSEDDALAVMVPSDVGPVGGDEDEARHALTMDDRVLRAFDELSRWIPPSPRDRDEFLTKLAKKLDSERQSEFGDETAAA